MEGFVNTNDVMPFEYGLRHSSRYANYGVDKIDRKTEDVKQTETKPSQTAGANKIASLSTDLFVGNIAENITDNVDKVIVEPMLEPEQDVHHKLRKAAVIGTSVLGVGALTMLFARGKGSKRTIEALGNIIDNATLKIEELKQKPSMSTAEGYYLSFLQKTNKVASRVRGAVFNITPLKDALFARLVRDKLGLKKPCDAITNGFRKMSFSTVKSAYKKAGRDIDNLTNLFAQTNERIAAGEFSRNGAVPDKEVLSGLKSNVRKIQTGFISSFNNHQLDKRNTKLIARFKGLDGKVYDAIYGKLKNFVSDVDEWTTFVPERLVAGEKLKILNNLAMKKRVITNSPHDNYNSMSELLTRLEKIIDPTDKESRNLVKNLRALSEKYVSLSGSQEVATRSKVISMMEYHLSRSDKITESGIYTRSNSKKIRGLVNKFRKVVNGDEKGAIEELLTQYKKLLPESEYLKLRAEAQKTIESLNKAVHKEGSEYVDKARDLAAGSALTDVAIGMTLPLATTSLAMASAKTKEKKRSVVLRYGLPLLAGVATSTAATLKLISGGKALMLASAVSIVCNEVFEKLDNYLIARDKKKAEVQS